MGGEGGGAKRKLSFKKSGANELYLLLKEDSGIIVGLIPTVANDHVHLICKK